LKVPAKGGSSTVADYPQLSPTCDQPLLPLREALFFAAEGSNGSIFKITGDLNQYFHGGSSTVENHSRRLLRNLLGDRILLPAIGN
jgi:hypothetical protein